MIFVYIAMSLSLSLNLSSSLVLSLSLLLKRKDIWEGFLQLIRIRTRRNCDLCDQDIFDTKDVRAFQGPVLVQSLCC